MESERLVWPFEEEILLNEISGSDKKLNEAQELDDRRFVSQLQQQKHIFGKYSGLTFVLRRFNVFGFLCLAFCFLDHVFALI